MTALTILGGRDPSGGALPPFTVTDGVVGPEGRGHVLDANGGIVAPGFVDLQINGGFGHDFTSDPASIWEVAARLPRFGVTAFLPTIISSDAEVVVEAREVLRSGPPPDWAGATPVGLHLEGPMISPERRGAHPESRLVEPAEAVIDSWGGFEGVRMVTLAPELAGATRVIQRLRSESVTVFLGHSAAGLDASLAGFEAGAQGATHLFNAMTGLDHRRPGLAAATLLHPTAYAGIIVDGEHVHPAMVHLAASMLGPERLFVVTDAMAAMGQGEGTYPLADVTVTVDGRRATTSDGVLAGSVLTMDRAVRNLIAQTGWEPAGALAAASRTPARVIGDRRRGAITTGCRGDVVVLDDDLEVLVTIVAGEILEDRR